ncbi:MAG: formate dehydrogenase subunit delta [Xanthomonadales bacterium]|nr:formate dehydrogenase subunit delta [Xanthomonadales bacterium]
MTVSVDKLIRMAEQIGANVSISTDPDIVAERLADHLRRFWDPRMREELCRAADQGVVLSPAVTAAVAMLKSSK